MIPQTSFRSKVFSGVALTMLFAATASSAELVGVTCIDISSPVASRVLELAATTVNEKYFSLAGSHSRPGAAVGSAVGTGLLVGDEMIATVNASSTVGSMMNATLYQFNFDTFTSKGTFKSITQQSISGTTALDYKSGAAAMVSCEAPLTSFAGSVPPPPTACFDNDGDGHTCAAIGGKDCNDSVASINPQAEEICGDGIDQNCNGIIDDPEVCSGGPIDDPIEDPVDDPPVVKNYPTFTTKGIGMLSQSGTNLVWMKDHYEKTYDGYPINWHSSVYFCKNLIIGDAKDWRLPTKEELLSIVDDRRSPQIDPLFTAKDAYYWTSDEYFVRPGTSFEVNVVDFGTGEVGRKGKQTTSGIARCVHN